VLTHPSTAPIPQQEFEADPSAFERRPIGAGPFSLSGPIESGRNILMSNARARTRGIQRAEFVIYDRTEDAFADFEDDRIDIAEVPPSRIDLARAKYGEAGFSPVAAGIYLGFNLSNAKFADVRLRRAISMGIDRVAIARSIYSGAIESATGLVPEGIPGRNAKACSGDCFRDVATASALVREVFPGGAPAIAYDHPAGGPNEAIAKSLASDLAEIGLTLEPRSRPAEVTAYFDLIAAGGQEMFFHPWPGEYPFADWFLTPLFRSGSVDNHTHYSVAEVDELLRRARGEPNLADRLALYGQIEQRVLADMPVVPIGFFRSRFVASKEVRGFYTDRLGGFEITRFGA
jgi:ABC-type oligopeptide transport system substrate-binding subunit